jgi:hypothetical protein
MQEDGLDILKEALFGDFPRTAKKAAAYGLRSMRGRMKTMAAEVLKQGLKRRSSVTKQVCKTALLLMEGKAPPKHLARGKRRPGRRRIGEIHKRSGIRTKSRRRNIPSGR